MRRLCMHTFVDSVQVKHDNQHYISISTLVQQTIPLNMHAQEIFASYLTARTFDLSNGHSGVICSFLHIG